MAVTKLLPNQQVPFSVKITDSAGNPAPVQAPSWQVTGPLRVVESNPPPNVVAPSGLRAAAARGETYSITVAATGEMGTGTVTFKCDADLGEGVKDLVATASVVVAPGEATVIELVPGPVTDQPVTGRK